ncbi:GH25205 [Drosophila grimshawi]|uniref:GH25205 n=1 Tax=Drosophila grimshawi TaxID=7222 RepID=B4JZ91_DROGR|nr:GH25205 [Drosophila grimshawi]
MWPLFNTYSSELRDWISSPYGIILMVTFVAYLAYIQIRREHPTYDDEDYENEGHVQMAKPLENLKLTVDKLKEYDYTNAENKYLVALLGIVYDVSSAPYDFGPNGKYKLLPGTDIIAYIKDTAQFLSKDFESYLNEWKALLEDHFYAAGVLITNEKLVSDSDGNLFVDDNEYKDVNKNEFGQGDIAILDSLNNDDQLDGNYTLLDSIEEVDESDKTLINRIEEDIIFHDQSHLNETFHCLRAPPS